MFDCRHEEQHRPGGLHRGDLAQRHRRLLEPARERCQGMYLPYLFFSAELLTNDAESLAHEQEKRWFIMPKPTIAFLSKYQVKSNESSKDHRQ